MMSNVSDTLKVHRNVLPALPEDRSRFDRADSKPDQPVELAISRHLVLGRPVVRFRVPENITSSIRSTRSLKVPSQPGAI